MIRAEFFQHEGLAECSPIARLLFIGLWTVADKEGRLEDRPRRIRAQLLPYEDCDLDDMETTLSELQRGGFIERYDMDGLALIQIVSFAKHQRPHPKEAPSELPARPASVEPKKPSDFNEPCNFPAQPGKAGTSRVKSPFPSGSSLPSGSSGSSHTRQSRERDRRALEEAFDEVFWPTFPRKENRKDALRAWCAKVDVDEIPAVMEGLAAWKASEQWSRGIIPHGSTWIRREAWKERPMVTPVARASPPGIHRNDLAEMEYLRKRGSLPEAFSENSDDDAVVVAQGET